MRLPHKWPGRPKVLAAVMRVLLTRDQRLTLFPRLRDAQLEWLEHYVGESKSVQKRKYEITRDIVNGS